MQAPELEFGSSQFKITPHESMPLAGFAYRENQPYSDITSDLFVKAFVFRIAGRTRCLLIADVLWWPPECIAIIREDVRTRWGIEAADLLLHATHTHCAPQTSSRFAPGLGALQAEWRDSVLCGTASAIENAITSLRPARILRFRGTSAISMNRRIDKGVDLPTTDWPEGEIDRELTTLLVEGSQGEPLGAIVHFACHPTILRGARVSAEFPGAMCDHLAGIFGNECIIGFLQGCSGDIGPAVERIDQASATSIEDVERVGQTLARDVQESLLGVPEAILPDSMPGSLTALPLPFERIPSRAELEEAAHQEGYLGEWAETLLEEQQPLASEAVLEIQEFRIGADLSIVAFNAEMVSHFGLLAKMLSGGSALPCSYSNGMIGYVVTDHQLRNGGYEVDESTKYFALPSRFAAGNEQVIENALKSLLRPSP